MGNLRINFISSLIFFMTMGELLFAQTPTLLYDKDNLLLELGTTVTLTVDNLEGAVEATCVPEGVVETAINGNTIALTALRQGVAKLTFISPDKSLLVYVTDKGKVTLWKEDWENADLNGGTWASIHSQPFGEFYYTDNGNQTYCQIINYYNANLPQTKVLKLSKTTKNVYVFRATIPNPFGCANGSLSYYAYGTVNTYTVDLDGSPIAMAPGEYNCAVKLSESNVYESKSPNGTTYFDDFLLTSTLPGVTVVKNSDGYETFSCTQPLDFTGSELTAYIPTRMEDGTIYFESITQLPPCTGALLTGPAGEYLLPIAQTWGTVEGDELEMVATPTAQYVMSDGDMYLMGSFGNEPVAFHRVEAGVTLKSNAGKAYLQRKAAGASGAQPLKIKTVDRYDAIETPRANTQTGVYTLQGVRVASPTQHGVYIVDGKKRVY